MKRHSRHKHTGGSQAQAHRARQQRAVRRARHLLAGNGTHLPAKYSPNAFSSFSNASRSDGSESMTFL